MNLLSPGFVVTRLGDHAFVAQPIQKGQQRRTHRQHIGFQLGQIGQRGVEQGQSPLLVKDREPDRQMRESFGQGLHKVTQCAFCMHHLVGRSGHEKDIAINAHDVAFIPFLFVPVADLDADAATVHLSRKWQLLGVRKYL